MNQNFYDKLESVLKKDTRFLDQDGEILKTAVIDKAYKADKNLVEILLSDKQFKDKFFSKVRDVFVFNINDFVDYIQDKNFLANSYTKYQNKIGLNIDGKFLNERKEVALVWPFKDCVLEGGMTKEDEKRKEVFFNEILAQDEIDRLFAPKVLTNWKRYSQDSISPLCHSERPKGVEESLKRDNNGTIRENLIIKGNNLLALHSLKQQFQGKIKLIYIDPPYNTGNDSFGYNDSFNHSTWLTFMKNRLEVARELLSDDGSIYVQADYNESHYLKLLLDEVFGRENFRNEIIWHYENKFKFEFTKNFNNDTESILFYSKKDGYQYFKHIKIDVKNKRKQNKITWDKNLKKMVTVKDEFGKVVYYESNDKIVGTLWNIPRINSQSRERLGLIGQKPEALIQRIFEASTKPNDIILDFFAGSGTTLAVAHKLRRQYIGVEQIESQIKLLLERLNNTTKGDQSGISKTVNWQGGGNFVYCELMQYNEQFVEKIQKAKNTKELLKIWEEMKEKSFLNYFVKPKEFEENIKEFKKFSLDKQKRILFDFLNKNQLYVNLSEIEDRDYKVSEEDKKMNGEFYGQNDNSED